MKNIKNNLVYPLVILIVLLTNSCEKEIEIGGTGWRHTATVTGITQYWTICFYGNSDKFENYWGTPTAPFQNLGAYGTYKVSGNKVTLKSGNSADSNIATIKGNSMFIDGDEYIKLF